MINSDEFPSPFELNIGNDYLRDSESRSNLSLRESLLQHLSYFVDFFDSEFSRFSSLSCGVSHVVLIGSDKQMIWIAARRIIAAMKDKIWIWVNPPSNQPSNPSADKSFQTPNRNISVAVSDLTAFPVPAFIVGLDVNFAPESISFRIRQACKRQSFSIHGRILSILST